MKLEFTLLVVDDSPHGIATALEILDDYLETKGFTLKVREAENLSEQSIRDLAMSEGRDYDLVMVDFNLGREDTDGAAISKRLRSALHYTDMVIYSAGPVGDLHNKLAEQKVAGVFVESRDNLDSALTGLADTVIGKAVDLNHMRGIAMAEVAEMDVRMEETLLRVFESDKCKDAKDRTIKKLRESILSNQQELEKCLKKSGLHGVVNNGRLFSSAKKVHAIKRVAKSLPGKPSEALEKLGAYESDILQNRNRLAHAKEESTENGKAILRSIKSKESDVIIDDNWMVDFRVKLKAQKSALTTVCDALDKHFGGA